ncbi:MULTISPECIES: tRNA adenosine(34) deaminase TadA [Thalassotalea]|uniref:tRNA adenosine(34) deaminase TadA n=1 Tax=Thalassotalea TaxID=1518149 RepID=UPI000944B7B2|nr:MULTISPECIES: tRNA adenosine(34) deaminase TadA [Thalassotalea]OKY26353.1 hypothetical protein BI291_12285 [Thalassotalea sp. PP2-459]
MTQYSQTEIDHEFMAKAYALALKAEQHDEIPVGAIVVADGNIIGEGFNQSIMQHDPSAHAEMIAIRQAGKTLENYRMLDCTLYVTLEPCPMCAGLLVHSRIKRVVFACADEKTGSAGTVFDLTNSDKLNHQIEISSGVMATECSALLSSFFKRRRKEKKLLKQKLKEQSSLER